MQADTRPTWINHLPPLGRQWLHLGIHGGIMIVLLVAMIIFGLHVVRVGEAWVAGIVLTVTAGMTILVMGAIAGLAIHPLLGASNEIYWPIPWGWRARVMRAVREDDLPKLKKLYQTRLSNPTGKTSEGLNFKFIGKHYSNMINDYWGSSQQRYMKQQLARRRGWRQDSEKDIRSPVVEAIMGQHWKVADWLLNEHGLLFSRDILGDKAENAVATKHFLEWMANEDEEPRNREGETVVPRWAQNVTVTRGQPGDWWEQLLATASVEMSARTIRSGMEQVDPRINAEFLSCALFKYAQFNQNGNDVRELYDQCKAPKDILEKLGWRIEQLKGFNNDLPELGEELSRLKLKIQRDQLEGDLAKAKGVQLDNSKRMTKIRL